VTTLAPDQAPSTATAVPAAPLPHGPAGHRPTKFLADLTRAMQAAAEQARVATLEQYRAEGTTIIEQIHAGSSTGAADLRRRADDDVAAIKEWSKAEIARIREETERRVAARREQLEGQLERHAALIEHEIEKVRGRVAAFEVEMGRFFDDLLGEEDPAVFAARAAAMPEPPAFADLEADTLASLLDEPGVGVPGPSAEGAGTASAAMLAAAPVTVPEPAAPEVLEAPEAVLVADAPQPADDREAAIAAIAAAAEAAAATENEAAAETEPEPTAEAEPETTSEIQPETTTDAVAEPEATVETEPEATASAAEGWQVDPEQDPRLAMLGLAPDFAAAEAAAAEAAASEVEDVPVMGDEALAARLSGLVPADAPDESETETVTTQVVTTGLVSVAAIASFKRHLGRLAGVTHVGVSSGPDGEFVFTVDHDPAASLRDLVPTIPGFAARIVGGEDGMLQVSAQDPQD
jgi:hypothetical protein